MLGYQPVMYSTTASTTCTSRPIRTRTLRPNGYAFLLLLPAVPQLALVAAVQHLMGLAMGVMIYALLRRRFRLPGWGARRRSAGPAGRLPAAARAPVPSDTMFAFLVVSAVTLLLARPPDLLSRWRSGCSWAVVADPLRRDAGPPRRARVC